MFSSGNQLIRECYCGNYVNGEEKWHPNTRCHYTRWMDTETGVVCLILKCFRHYQ